MNDTSVHKAAPAAASAREYIGNLDGLRAVAILLVLVFHLDESLLGGGFVGVDVFFVISGFIITRNIWQSIARGGFSLFRFYHHRVLRLLPALIVTVLVSLWAAWLMFPSTRVGSFAESGAYAITSLANFHFFFNSSYFDDDATSNLFLHAWSLSVEEQFYLFWPMLMLLLAPKPFRRLSLALGGLAVITAATLWLFERQPEAGFFLMPGRVFQFGMGAVVAAVSLAPRGGTVPMQSSTAATLAGLALIVYSAAASNGFAYDAIVAALVPAAGAALVIASIRSRAAALVLGTRPMRALGNRAYSLYLVHWPIVILYNLHAGPGRPWYVLLGLAVACLVATELLYRGVEGPLRVKPGSSEQDVRRSGVVVFLLLVGSLASTIYIVTSAHRIGESAAATAGAPAGDAATPPPQAGTAIRYGQITGPLWRQRMQEGWVDAGCQLQQEQSMADFKEDFCINREGPHPRILVIGDSYGAEGLIMFREILPGATFSLATVAGCLPIHPEPNWGNRKPVCREMTARQYALVADPAFDAIVVATNLRHWTVEQLASTTKQLADSGKPVLFMGPRPSFTERVPTLLDMGRVAAPDYDLSGFMTYDIQDAYDRIDAFALAKDARISFVDIMPYLCPDGCPAVGEEGLRFLDVAHLTAESARRIAQAIERDSGDRIRAFIDGAPAGRWIGRGAVPVARPAPADGSNVTLRLTCSPLGELPGFSRLHRLRRSGDTLTLAVGKAGEQGYEAWSGPYPTGNGATVLEGEYLEGPGGLKKARFSVRADAGTLVGEGRRGPRDCRLAQVAG